MPYTWQYGLGIAATIALGIIGAIQASGGEILGVSSEAMAWLGIIATGLGIGRSFLPNIRRPPEEDVHFRD